MAYRVTVKVDVDEFAIFAYDNVELLELLDYLDEKHIQFLSVVQDPVFMDLAEFQEFLDTTYVCPQCQQGQQITDQAKEDIERNLKDLDSK